MKFRLFVVGSIGLCIVASNMGCSESKEAIKPSTFAPAPPKNAEATPEGNAGAKSNAVSDG
jgi:hypothetical protein